MRGMDEQSLLLVCPVASLGALRRTFFICLSLPYASDRATLFLMPLVSMPMVAPLRSAGVLTSFSEACRFMALQLPSAELGPPRVAWP